MEMGINQVLGFVPYVPVDKEKICEHQDDGHIYGETLTKLILHCDLCGEFYEETKP